MTRRWRWKTWLIGAGVVAGVAVAASAVAGLAFRHQYPGFTRGFLRQLTTATGRENRNLYFCITYWTEFMGKLELDPRRGVYVFPEGGPEVDDFERGRRAFHRGEFARAVDLIDRDVRGTGETETKLFWLAMACLRRGEAENCLARLRPSSAADALPDHCAAGVCTLPLTVHHTRTEGSDRAAVLFTRLLDRYDSRNPLYRWLLNFTAMTLGRYPDGVPERYVVRNRFTDLFSTAGAAAASPEARSVTLNDRARALGADVHATGRGVAVEDFDGDGYLDIIVAAGFEGLTYLKNEAGTRFLDRTAESGLGAVRQPFALTTADYDNDGRPDLFVACPFGNFKLFRNLGGGTFANVTAASGLLDALPAGVVSATWIPSWADVDNDGWVDLFVPQWGLKLPFVEGLLAQPRQDSRLFLNVRGRFVDATERFGLGAVVRDQYFIGSAFGDYDRDGYPDLFLSSPLRATSILLHNDRGRRFVATDLIRRAEGGFSAAFLDADHDGRLDLFQAGFADATTSTEMAVFGAQLDTYCSAHSTIFYQTDDGRFQERADLFDLPVSTMGASFGDLNNDGAFDFYLGAGTPEPWFILPHLLYMGRLDGDRPGVSWANASMLHGAGTVQKGHGIVFFDFDGDGDQDLFSALGGMWPGDRWPSQLFVNEGPPARSWLKVRLRGTRTNRAGLGATVRVVARRPGGQELVRYHQIDQKTGFGSAPALAEVGLLDAERVERIDVYWPGSGRWRSYPGRLGALNVLDEFGPDGEAVAATAAGGRD